ncbi:MAG: BLUF domain-containing protein [Rhodothermales bacterium]
MSLLHTLLYRSRATRELDERDLLPILMSSMRNNARVGVTGLLLYGPPTPLPEPDPEAPPPTTLVPFEGPGVFVQWLEGPEAAVRATYDRIDADRRHTDVEVLARGTRERRLFPHWSMALETVRALPETVADVERLAEQRHDHQV